MKGRRHVRVIPPQCARRVELSQLTYTLNKVVFNCMEFHPLRVCVCSVAVECYGALLLSLLERLLSA